VSARVTLPRGVSFDDRGSGGGLLSGRPRAGSAGQWRLTVIASDGQDVAAQQLLLTVTAPPRFTSSSRASATVGTRLKLEVETSGYPDATVRAVSLPWWLHLVQQEDGSARLAGMPPSPGTYVVRLQASGDSGTTTQRLRVRVSARR
jgi:Putative Ig domain